MQIYDSLDQPGAIEAVAALLRPNGVVVLPTDTVYGFSGLLTSQSAYDRIATLKGDVSGRRYLVLAASIDMIEDFISSWGCASREDLDAMWPSPLTAVLPANPEGCPAWVGETIAIRVPKLDGLRDLIRAAGEPLISTSVNVSGEPPMRKRKKIVKAFGDRIDAFVAADKKAPQDAVSTLVDFTGDEPAVLRRGGVLWG